MIDQRPTIHDSAGADDSRRARQHGGCGARTTGDFAWLFAAALLAVVVAGAMRVGTGIADRPTRWDERYIRVPIDDLIRDGWSVRTAIDFVETKGPGFIWPYAVLGDWIGASLGDLRFVSVLWLVLGVVPLLAIADRCGIRGPPLVGVVALYMLLPQQAILGQLLMSEAIFVTGTLVLAWTATIGLAPAAGWDARTRIERAAPVLFCLLLVLLLHMRIHAVASAGAICLVAMLRVGPRSWPWFLAALIAGLARIPLWLRWGGLVSPEYQYMHQLGAADGALFGLLHLANATYLVAAGVPFVGVLGVAALCGRMPIRGMIGDGVLATRRNAALLGGAIAAVLAVAFAPQMSDPLALPPTVAEFAPFGTLERYLGLTATLARTVDQVWGQTAVIALLAAVAGAGLGALWIDPRTLRPGVDQASSSAAETPLRLVEAITFWTLIGGVALYTLADSFVFDRYLLPWAALLPIVWWRRVPPTLLAIQACALLILAAGWTRIWLLR